MNFPYHQVMIGKLREKTKKWRVVQALFLNSRECGGLFVQNEKNMDHHLFNPAFFERYLP